MFNMKFRSQVKHKYHSRKMKEQLDALLLQLARGFVAKRKKPKLSHLLLFLMLSQNCVIDLCILLIICIQNDLYLTFLPSFLHLPSVHPSFHLSQVIDFAASMSLFFLITFMFSMHMTPWKE